MFSINFLIIIFVLLLGNFINRGSMEKGSKCKTPPNTIKNVKKYMNECQDEVKLNIIKEAWNLLHYNDDDHDDGDEVHHEINDYHHGIHSDGTIHIVDSDAPDSHYGYKVNSGASNNNNHHHHSTIFHHDPHETHILHHNPHEQHHTLKTHNLHGLQYQQQQQPQHQQKPIQDEYYFNPNDDQHQEDSKNQHFLIRLLNKFKPQQNHDNANVNKRQTVIEKPLLKNQHPNRSSKNHEFINFHNTNNHYMNSNNNNNSWRKSALAPPIIRVNHRKSDDDHHHHHHNNEYVKHSTILSYHDKRIAGCLLHCVYGKNNAIDKIGWPTLDGLVNLYTEGVGEHGYFMATLRATDYCLKGASLKYHINRSALPEKGESCDLAFDVFDCISDRITEYCSEHN